MTSSPEPSPTLAILIDADNANPAIVKGLIDEVARLGRATVRRIYGDWTTPNLGSWKAVLLEHSITPIQQFAYTRGKNATDSTMIIDAMDLLYAGNVEGFCLVSSDSDFTRLASRLKESGKSVYGFGEKKTPQPFVAACDRFIYTEVFARAEGQSPRRKSPAELDRDAEFLELAGGAVDDASDDSGWAHLGEVGSILTKKRPDFDSRNYGYSKLSDLLEASQRFEVRRGERGVDVRKVR
ncbi:MAG TPA: NYN domain-containing protein [Steroidobacteraceae bacterium]|nr:NYN domain-containing protein [Steroidobacteraceae bacterium]